MPQAIAQDIAVTDTVVESITLGPATAQNLSFPTSAPYSWTNGTGANQVDLHFERSYTLAAAATITLTLSALTDDLARTVAFARVRKLMIYVTTKTGNDYLTVGNAATHPWASPFGGGTQTFVVRGLELKVAPDATGFVVAAGSSDQLLITNSGSASMTFTVTLSGASV